MSPRPLVIAAALCVAPTALRAQSVEPAPIAVLTARDSATELRLTPDAVELRFTPAGAREAAVGVVPTKARARWNWLDTVFEASAQGVRTMRMRLPLADVASTRVEGDSLVLQMRGSPSPETARGARGRFVYQDVPAAEARAFVRALEAARRRAGW